MRVALQAKLSAAGMKQDMSFITRQKGMFSYSGLGKEQMQRLRSEFGIYGVDSGRICVGGGICNRWDDAAALRHLCFRKAYRCRCRGYIARFPCSIGSTRGLRRRCKSHPCFFACNFLGSAGDGTNRLGRGHFRGLALSKQPATPNIESIVKRRRTAYVANRYECFP